MIYTIIGCYICMIVIIYLSVTYNCTQSKDETTLVVHEANTIETGGCTKWKPVAKIRKWYSDMQELTQYYVLKQKAVPEVLLKVVEAKKLVESGKEESIQKAVEKVGLSRSSFYKYKDDIFEFHDTSQGTTINLVFQMDDEPGILSDVLKVIAEFGANILTIHQSIPINGVASLSLSIQTLPTTGNLAGMLEQLGEQHGVHHVKMLAKD